MANLEDCITAAIETGSLSEIEAAQVRGMAASERFHKNGMPDDMARNAAERDAVENYFAEKELSKRQKYLQVEAMQKNITRIDSHEEGSYTGLMSLLVNDITRKAKYNNVDVQAKVLTGRFRAQIAELMEAYRPTNAGFSQDKDAPRRMLIEALGESTGDADAKKFAELWAMVAEDARQLFNAAGGSIRKRNDWGMKQNHDITRISGKTYEQWRDDILPLLDVEKMSEQTMNSLRAEMQNELVINGPIIERVQAQQKRLKEIQSKRSQRVVKEEAKQSQQLETLTENIKITKARLASASSVVDKAKAVVSQREAVLNSVKDADLKKAAVARLEVSKRTLAQKEEAMARANQKHERANTNLEEAKTAGAKKIEDIQAKELTVEGVKIKEELEKNKLLMSESKKRLDDLEFRHKKMAERLDTDEIDLELKETYDRITTGGMSDIKELGEVLNPSKVANRHQQSRELIFNKGSDYLIYHDKYGKGDIYGNMMNHLDQMANEISLMEIMGPNPEMQFKALKEYAKAKEFEKTGSVPSKHKDWILGNVWHIVSGEVNDVISTRFANLMTGLRSQLVGAQLGAATLSAVSDLALTKAISGLNGMNSLKVFKRFFKQLNPKSKADRLQAAKMGLMADAWIGTASGSHRFAEVVGSASGAGKPKFGEFALQKYADTMAKVSDITMRASLMTPWEQAGRNAFGMEYMSFLAENSAKSFDELPRLLKKSFGTYSITAKDWDVMRKLKHTEIDGVSFLRPQDIIEMKGNSIVKNRLMSKFQRMVIQETDYAIPRPDARVRAILMQSTKKGTFSGEMVRSATMYKSFPVTLMSMHFYRMMAENGVDKLAYISQLFIGMTVMGGIGYNAKELSKGREPIPMDTPKFWAAAAMQGGGLGLLGDLMFSDQNRYGGGIGSTLGGPAVGLFDDVLTLTVGSAQKLVAGEDAKLGLKAMQFAKRYTPGSSLWYARLAFERAIWDQVQKEVDPEAKQKFQRMVRKRKNEYNQNYWWKPQ